MNLNRFAKSLRYLLTLSVAIAVAGCGQGDGPTPIPGTPAPPVVVPPPDCDLAINFEDECGAVVFNDFGGGTFSIVNNPDASGINTSDKVAQMLKFAGEVFGGSTIVLDESIDFSQGEVYKVKVWASREVPVLFKFEGLEQERSVTHSGGGTWQELCFDFRGSTSGPASSAITFIFDLGVNGMAGSDPDNWTFFVDDVTQTDSCATGGGGGPLSFPIGFEAAPDSYDFGVDGGFGGGFSDVIANPDTSGLNASAQVARMQKFAGEVFAGSTLNLGANVDFSAGEVFKMKVWASRAVPVLFKFEGLNQERSVDHSGSSSWEELCFDFTGSTSGPASNAITFIFDLGVVGDATGDPDNWTFYFDEIEQVADCAGGGGGSAIALPVTFNDSSIDYELTDFGGVATTLVADPDNAANTVASTNKPPGAELWGGTTVAETSGFADPIPFTATDTSMTLRVWSPDAGIPVRLKVEDRTDNTISVETEATTTVAGAWETLTFDFSNEVSGTAALNLASTYDKASVFFNFGTDGNTAGDKTYLWDDLAFVAGGGGGGSAIALPVTFDEPSIDYELTDFGGVTTSLTTDPDDNTNTVASTNKPPGAELWGGTTVAETSGFSSPIPFTATDTSMTLRVWSPDAGIPVRLKVEDKTDNTISVETEATTTVAGAWETLTFDFSNEVSGTAALNLANTYDKASVFFNFGTDGNTAGDKTYLWDDLAFATGGGGGGTSVDFEGGSYTFNDFGGAVTAVITNPSASGINVSAQVAQMQKFAGETFAGSTLDLGGAVNLAAADSYTMKVLAQRSVVVTFKLETGGAETTATYSGSGGWEELCFDFTGVAATVTGITVIFDNGTAGDAANDPDNWTFQFDDIQQVTSCPSTGGGGNFSTITFDDPTVTYTLTDFGGNGSTLTNDPAGGTNTVAQTVKSGTAELWAGTTVSTEPNEAVPTIPLDASNTQMSVRVWSPDAGIPVRLKIEDASDNTITVETEATTTVANAWETLIFDFANEAPGTAAFNPANTYNKISIFFNFGTDGATAGEKTYYFDDIAVVSGGGGGGGSTAITLPVTFEDAGLDYELQDFGGVATALIADPDDAANTVASSNKPPGAELWGGTTVANVTGFGAIPFTATDTTMTLRVYSPDTGIPVRLKVEDVTDPTISVETEATTTVAGAWETLTFDFSNEVSGTAALNLANTYDKASVFFNFGTDGNTAGDKTYLWDDLTFATGGGGGGSTSITLPVTFEDAGLDYELQDFGGVATALIADPDDAANTVASSNKPPGAEVWGGTTVANVSGFGAIPFTVTDTSMTLRVWSPDAGIPVRLKVEDVTDAGISVETEATTTVAGAWETLTFDFSNEVSGTAALNLANTYDKASVFFNFGTDGNTAGDKTYLWDDLTFVIGGGGGSTSVDFEGGSYTFNDFGGAVTAVVANPNASGIDTSAQVAQMQKFAGETFAGSTLDLGGAVDLAAADSYTMKVLAQRSVVVTFKLETGGAETTATYSGSGGWEELCFDFTGVAATVTGITIIFDNGTAGDAANDPDNWTFQFDDIQQVGSCPSTGGGGTFTTITFDDLAVTYTLTDFGGTGSTITNDPAGGTNNVAQTVKSGTAEVWAGTTVSTEPNEAVPTIPLDASNTQMSVLVYSPDAGIPVRLKIEDASDNTITAETEATTTVANAWETLTFDFANEAAGTAAFNPANTYNKISIFFNFGTDGATAGEKTYYFDDIAVVSGGGGGSTAITLPVTFEDAGLDYELQDFGGVATALIADPDDAANTVASSNKPPGAEVWGGTTVANVSGFGAIPFTVTDTSMTLRVWSPDAGIPVRLKVEDVTDAGISVETEATTTVAGAWETLTFDFSNEVSGTAALNLANTYDKASVFFNFGTDGNTAGDKTYLWDDLTFVTGGGGGGGGAGGELAVNGDFEDGDLNGWEVFDSSNSGNGGTISVTQPGSDASGPASTFAGNINITAPGNPTLKQANLGAGQLTPGQQVTVSFDWRGTDANGGVVDIVLFSELSGGGVSQTDAILTGGGFPAAWTTVGPVNINIGPDVSGGITLQITAICGGTPGCESNVFIDNVSITAQ